MPSKIQINRKSAYFAATNETVLKLYNPSKEKVLILITPHCAITVELDPRESKTVHIGQHHWNKGINFERAAISYQVPVHVEGEVHEAECYFEVVHHG